MKIQVMIFAPSGKFLRNTMNFAPSGEKKAFLHIHVNFDTRRWILHRQVKNLFDTFGSILMTLVVDSILSGEKVISAPSGEF